MKKYIRVRGPRRPMRPTTTAIYIYLAQEISSSRRTTHGRLRGSWRAMKLTPRYETYGELRGSEISSSWRSTWPYGTLQIPQQATRYQSHGDRIMRPTVSYEAQDGSKINISSLRDIRPTRYQARENYPRPATRPTANYKDIELIESYGEAIRSTANYDIESCASYSML